ncbi:MAG: hypothetical protein J0H23_11555 [Micrococcales bacterium]|nr:hypothetical protein [Micrococcales bacterium]OJX69405.1 MAG: hypothetical protein BGO94_12860 [Micrococcales bacterium 72-143]
MDEEGIQSISDGAWVPGDLTSLVLLRVGLGREWRLQDGNPGLMLEETAVFNDVELRAVEATLEAFDPVVRTDEGADEPFEGRASAAYRALAVGEYPVTDVTSGAPMRLVVGQVGYHYAGEASAAFPVPDADRQVLDEVTALVARAVPGQEEETLARVAEAIEASGRDLATIRTQNPHESALAQRAARIAVPERSEPDASGQTLALGL